MSMARPLRIEFNGAFYHVQPGEMSKGRSITRTRIMRSLRIIGGLSYSAVAKVHQRFSAEAQTNKPLSKILSSYLSTVKG